MTDKLVYGQIVIRYLGKPYRGGDAGGPSTSLAVVLGARALSLFCDVYAASDTVLLRLIICAGYRKSPRYIKDPAPINLLDSGAAMPREEVVLPLHAVVRGEVTLALTVVFCRRKIGECGVYAGFST